MEFKRSMGFWAMVFASVGGMLGSGWLFAPYYTAQLAGPSALLSWVLGAIFTLLIALTFAELTSMFPVSGSLARFMQFSHGTMSSFIFTVIMLLGYSAVAPVETIGILQYLSEYFPNLVETKAGVTLLTHSGYGWAALILLAMCLLNFVSIKWLSRYNSMASWLKVGLPLILIVVLISLIFAGSNFSYDGFFPNGIAGTGKALSSGGIVFAYLGFAVAIALAGEAKDVQRTIPRVLICAVGICMLVYLSVQVAFIGALTPQDLSHGWAQLSFPNDASPFIGIIERLHLNTLTHLVFITAIIAPVGTAVIFIASTARITYAMAENAYFPKFFLYLSKKGVPTKAVALNFVIGLILFLPSPGWQSMMSFLVSALVFCHAIGPVSLVSLRKELPDHARPYKLPIADLWCLFAFFLSNLILYWAGWQAYAEMVVFLAIAMVVFFVSRLVNPKLKKVELHLKQSIWAFVYLIGMGIIFYLGKTFVRHEPSIPGAIIVFVFSWFVLRLAKRTSLPTAKIRESIASI